MTFAFLLRHRRPLEWAAYCAVLAAAAAGLLYLHRTELARYHALEHSRLENLAGVVASNIQTDLEATNHALTSLVREARARPDADAGERGAELAKLVSVMPGVRAMLLLDRDGVVAASDQPDLLGRQLGARAYFQLARARPDPATLFVSAPFRSVRGDLVIALSRVITTPGGGFAGLALATLDPEYFTAKFRSARYSPDVWGYVVHGGGVQLLNYPVKPGIDGSDLSRPGSLFQRHRALGAGASVQQGAVITTGEVRMMALRTIQPPALRMDHAIVIGLSREVAAIALQLRGQARGFAALWGGAALAGALGLALAQRWRRQVRRLSDERQGERRRLDALAGSERRFRTLIEDAPLPVAMLRHGRFIYSNPRYRTLHGYAPEDDLSGLPWSAMIADSSRLALRREQALIEADSAQEQNFEAMGLGKAGSEVPVLKATTRVALADGDATLVFAQDISAQKRAEAELTLARDAAERAGRAKADFLADMSHEIRSPLNAILGLAYLLERMRLEDDARDTVRRIRAAGESLLGVVNNVLDVSKIEAGHMTLERAPFRLAELIDRVASGMAVAAADKPLELVIDAAPPGVDALAGDALRLQQVLTNLTGNAIKFTPAGKVVLSVRPLAGPAGAARLAFSVLDTGIGIDPARHGAIFAPFSQEDSSTTRRFGGTGLGLSISRRLLRLMGAELAMRSTPGVGSEFSFELTLPLAAGGAPAAAAARGAQLRGVRLLVVDDSEVNREVVERIVRAEGAASSGAGDGQAALDWLAAHPGEVDVVLMDIQMPVMDGIEATRRIRRLPGLAGLPVIALTAGAFSAQRQAALDAGVNHFISKPFDVAATVALIRQATSAPAPVDAAQGLELWGDEAGHHAMLGRFARCYGGVAAAIERRAAAGDAAGAAALAHKLAGVCASLALPPLCARAQQAERALRDGAADGAPAALAAELARALAAIAALAPPPPLAAPTSATTAQLLARLLAELPAADPTPLEPLLLQLQARLGHGDWAPLRERVLGFDFGGAAALAGALLASQEITK
jgi:PAS domain S-box-containing protein